MAESSADEAAALAFLREGRSRFLSLAADWLEHLDDPVDLLFVMTRETGQALGPWETFRFCALLGLTPSRAVRELGLDVLAEPLDAHQKVPPIAQAMAIAHAKDRWPQEDAPHTTDVFSQLERRLSHPSAHPALVAAAALAIGGALPDGDLAQRCGEALDADDAAAVAGPIWEAALLRGAAARDLCSRAMRVCIAGQQADGGFTALGEHHAVRGFATVRALALLRRARAQSRD